MSQMPQWMKAGALVDGQPRIVIHASSHEILVAEGAEETWQYDANTWYGLMPIGYSIDPETYIADPMRNT